LGVNNNHAHSFKYYSRMIWGYKGRVEQLRKTIWLTKPKIFTLVYSRKFAESWLSTVAGTAQ
jgi:hypothetical protein